MTGPGGEDVPRRSVNNPVVPDCIEAQWPAPANIRACTFTRNADEPPSRAQLTAWLGTALPDNCQLPRLQQVHGSDVVHANQLTNAQSPPQADGIYAAQPWQLCGVRTADCLPVLLCDRQGQEIAAVHAGWRGLAAGVIESALECFQSPSAQLMAWLGPAISQTHFQVGSEVCEAFVDAAPAQDRNATQACFRADGDRYRADLYALARLRLQNRGVTQISGGERCTYGEARSFHSYRRDGAAAGRLTSVILRTD